MFVGWYKNSERETFADNSKYVFLYTAQHLEDIRAIWIGADNKLCTILQERGYEAYNVHSLKGAYYSLRAGYTIIDAVMRLANWRYSGGCPTVQLWHADGIKKLTFTDKWKSSNWKKVFWSPGTYKRFSFIIASSSYIRTNFMAPSFCVEEERVRITGLPRYDSLFSEIKDADIDTHTELTKTLKTIKANDSNRILLYAPTFRRGVSLPGQLSPLNLSKLNGFLTNKNYHLVISLHPKFASSNWVPEEKYSNIFFSNPGFDQYPLLPEFDVLITDYSSTCIEFLLLNKPTIFYIYDIEEYRKNEGLAEEFWNYMPGPRVRTYEEFTKAIDTDIEVLKKGSDEVRKTIFKYRDGDSSKRVVEEILKDLSL